MDELLNQISLQTALVDTVRELALNIRVAIATQGIVWLDSETRNGSSKGPHRANVKSAKSGVSSTAADGKSTAADGKSAAADVKATAADGESTATDGESTAADGESTAADVKAPAADVNSKELDEQISNTDGRATTSDLDGHGDETTAACSPYRRAVLELADPLIAVKGHGLIELRRLIQRSVGLV